MDADWLLNPKSLHLKHVTYLYVMEGENVEEQWEDLGLVDGGVPGVGNGWKSVRVNPPPSDPQYPVPHPSVLAIYNEITGDTGDGVYMQRRIMGLGKRGSERKLCILTQPSYTTEYSNAYFA